MVWCGCGGGEPLRVPHNCIRSPGCGFLLETLVQLAQLVRPCGEFLPRVANVADQGAADGIPLPLREGDGLGGLCCGGHRFSGVN